MDTYTIDINGDSFPIYYIPSKNKNNKKMIVYVPGLNGNGSFIESISNKFKNYSILSFDPRAQANNNSKPYRSYKKYISDLKEIIEVSKDKYNIRDVYLIGESWGAALSILYTYKYGGIKKVCCWNCPYKIKNIENDDSTKDFKRNLKMIWTFLFSFDTYDDSPFNKQLINNKVILRTINIFRRKTISNKVIIAAWKSFKPAWKIMIKNKINNFMYIQSLEDIMLHKATLKKIKNISNYKIYEKGFHVLLFDINSSEILLNDIADYFEK